MRQNTEKKVFDYIKKYNLIKEGDKVVAGVSGGADSMCMLLLLLELKKSMDISITVAHVDHGIRGAEAKADAGFVKSFCESHSIGFELAETDIPAIV
ncbi:MAG: tRNA(Ile)-lysidine synthetase, partial [Lachnospiraceae bacterium]|nr:tRNA(Ile)-lysidine synthetase [Lachnospiraceae bacterium]